MAHWTSLWSLKGSSCWNKILLPLAVLTAVQIGSLRAQSTASREVTVEVYDQATYTAAVLAHAAVIPNDTVPVSRSKALENMEINLKVFREYAKEAQDLGVDIIVFPEDGIYGMLFNRQTIYPYLEYMPDPSTVAWVPCDEPNRYNNTEVQVSLSCMAKQNQLYLVANIGDKQPCDASSDITCPQDGRYQYNTDVAYGPDGTFLAKYHKHNLFFEDQFDKPVPEYVYFDTPFGRFGLMTCFDVLFEEPGIPLVERYNVTNIAFPTAWMDALPLLPAIGFHSSFALAHRVNFLSANIHVPAHRFDGSGLYGPEGAHDFVYESMTTGEPPVSRLVVDDMNVIASPQTRIISNLDPARLSATRKRSSVDSVLSSPKEFQAKLFEDTYLFRTLDKPSGKLEICQNKVCCELEYTIQADTFSSEELFAFGVFDGLHTHEGKYYMQNCALVKCADARNRTSCGSVTFDSSTLFTKLKLRGHFQTPYVYPQIVFSDPYGDLGILPPGAWKFQNSSIVTVDGYFKDSILNAILLGRDYTRDDEPVGGSGPRLVISLLLLVGGSIAAQLMINV